MGEALIKWLVPFLAGSIVTLISTFAIKLKAIKEGLQCLLRMEIIRAHDKYTDKGYCPIYAKESLTRAYKAYHALGGNDVATELYHDTIKLPTEPPEKGDSVYEK